MRIRLVAATAALVLAGALTACSDATNGSGSGSVWVANEGADSLTVLDAASNAVVVTVAGIKEPHNVQVSRGGEIAYALSSATNTVVAIDAATYTVNAVAATGSAPAHVIEAPNGKVYVTNAEDGTMSVYRGPELTPVGRIELGGMPHGLRPAAGGSMIVVANTMAGRLDLIDPTTDRSTGTVPVGKGPAQVAVTADGRYAYSGVTEPPAVVKADLVARKVVGMARVPTAPVQVYLTPDEDTVLSANQGTAVEPGHTVSVIATEAMTDRGTVDTGSGPHGVVIDTSGRRAWVTNTFDDTVSVIDLNNLSMLTTIAVGNAPNGVSYSGRLPAAATAATATLNVPAPSPHGENHSGNGHGH